ncbi:hypothetical protein D9M70_649550 [compost metagenome]
MTAADRDLQLQTDDRVVNPWRQRLVEPVGNAHEQPAPKRVEQALKGVENHDDGEKGNKGRQAPARQHPIIHFHHEERSGEV